MTVYWFVATTAKLPGDQFSDGIFWSEEMGAEADVPEESLAYALLCRACAGAELEARGLVAKWFAEDDLAGAPTLLPVDVSTRLTRREQAIAAGMKPGEVLVRSVFVAYPKAEAKGRREAEALFEAVVRKRWWQFWR